MEQQKNKNREGDGASDFDGFCWMGGHNNQLKSSRHVGVNYGETACRAMTIWEDTIESFRPGQKINITKFVVALDSRQPTTACNNQPNLRWIDGRTIREDA